MVMVARGNRAPTCRFARNPASVPIDWAGPANQPLACLPKKGANTVINSADTAWMLTATALVLLMTLPALALFYGGLVQAKNILSVLVQCAAVAALCSVLWFGMGYSLAYSGSGDWLGDHAAFLLGGLTRDAAHPGTHIPESVYVMFQMTFAVITPALIIGAYVERIRFAAVLLISALWLLIVYAPVAHWVWGGGWLAKMGVMDFAGGIVVHVTAGVSALVIAWMIRPRHEFPHGIRPPHAPWMVMVGRRSCGWAGSDSMRAVPCRPVPMPAWRCWPRTCLPPAPPWSGWPSNGSNSA